MNTISRRVVLGGIVAAPAVFGLRYLLGQEKAEAPAGEPEWLGQALRRMRETGRWGVVIVAPPDEDARRGLGAGLYALTELDDEDVEAHDLFCQAVFVVLSGPQARSHFPKVPGADRILLGPGGNPIAWDTAGFEVYADSAKFTGSFRPFIHGPEGSRLKERAKAIEEALPEALKKAARELGADSVEERSRAAVLLTRDVEKITPYLGYLQREGATEEVRSQAKLLLRRYFATLPGESFGNRLPYGCYLRKFVGSCSCYVPEDELTMQCGLGRVSKRSRKFVSFLAKS